MDTSTLGNPLDGLIADDQAPRKEAAAVQHCLVYLSGELRKLGLSQAARLVDDAVRQVSDVQRFCEADRAWDRDGLASRRRPPDDAGYPRHGRPDAAYMIPGE